jgi:hypothetical protein
MRYCYRQKLFCAQSLLNSIFISVTTVIATTGSSIILPNHATLSEPRDSLNIDNNTRLDKSYKQVLRLNSTKELSFRDRETYKVIIIDNYCDADLVDRVRKALLDSEFSSSPQDRSIRSDHVRWLRKEEYDNIDGGDISILLRHMNSLAAVFSDDVVRLEPPSHYQAALYNGSGERYVKHMDNKPRGRRNIDDDSLWLSNREQRDRFLTCILYLTPSDWRRSDGGMLRCYLGDEQEDQLERGEDRGKVIDISPKRGRLVVFRSCDLAHEVLPTLRDGRLALTGWMVGSAPR